VSRYDKYDPYDGGYRARLNAAIAAVDVGKMRAVSINGSGRVVIGGAAATDLKGIICPTEAMPAGAPIDVMTDGEIEDVLTTGGVAIAAGATVYGHIDGTVDAVATAGKAVGFTVEATRLVVRCNPV
jgi:hypothetical protein